MSKSDLTHSQQAIQRAMDKAMDTVLKYAAPTVPPLNNYTPEGMVEEMGPVNEAKKALDKVEKILKERFKTIYRGPYPLRGDNYNVEVKAVPKYALSQELAKAKLLELGGEEALKACMVDSEVSTMYIKTN